MPLGKAPALLLQGLTSGIEQCGDVEGYMIFVSARSGPTRKDGVLVALCMRTFASSEVTAVHEIVKGALRGQMDGKWKRALHLGQDYGWKTAEYLRAPPC